MSDVNPFIYDPARNNGNDLSDLSADEAYEAGVSAGLDAGRASRDAEVAELREQVKTETVAKRLQAMLAREHNARAEAAEAVIAAVGEVASALEGAARGGKLHVPARTDAEWKSNHMALTAQKIRAALTTAVSQPALTRETK